MVGSRRVDVDDRAAHRDLAARLHLVLAPVPHRDELLDQTIPVELVTRPHDDRLERLDVRTEPLHQRAHRSHDHGRQDRGLVVAVPQPPDDAQPPAHGLDRGRDPLERQRLPGREQLDLVGPEVLAQIGGEPFGFDPGRYCEHDRAARGSGRERGREECARRFGNRDRARAPAVAAATIGSDPSNVVSPPRAGRSGISANNPRSTIRRERAITRDARAPGVRSIHTN